LSVRAWLAYWLWYNSELVVKELTNINVGLEGS
jgi:hypothetical protein